MDTSDGMKALLTQKYIKKGGFSLVGKGRRQLRLFDKTIGVKWIFLPNCGTVALIELYRKLKDLAVEIYSRSDNNFIFYESFLSLEDVNAVVVALRENGLIKQIGNNYGKSSSFDELLFFCKKRICCFKSIMSDIKSML